MFTEFIEKLENQLQKQLPGSLAQIKMSPKFRVDFNFDNSRKARQSAVMLIFYPEAKYPKLIFIKRKEDGKAHSGQIAFPGGKYEEADKNLKNTAIRETYEEIGVQVPEIQIIGKLTSLYIPVSNFDVYPFISYLNSKPDFIINNQEVERIIEIKIDELFHKTNIDKKIFIRNKIEIEAPFFRANGDIIWGATAMILSELKEIYHQI